MVLFKIAFRNAKKDKKSTSFLFAVFFIVMFFFLALNFIMNGIEGQVTKNYVNLQSGHVAVEWDEMKQVDTMDKSKFLTSIKSFSTDEEDEDKNDASIELLNKYLESNKEKIDECFPVIKRTITYKAKNQTSVMILYGIEQDDADYIQKKESVIVKEGTLLSDKENAICISEQEAESGGYHLGDTISATILDLDNNVTDRELTITGIYKNGAGYDNLYGYIKFDDLQDLYAYKDGYFDYMRVFLKDKKDISEFATDLTEELKDDTELYAEGYENASEFYMNFPNIMRMFFNVFSIVLLLIIGVGVNSTVQMNLYRKLKSYGILRATGFSKRQCFGIIFFQMLIICLFSLTIATVVLIALVWAVNTFGDGIYVGTGVITYAVGGERFYPEVRIGNILLGVCFMGLISLLTTGKTALSVLSTDIVDLLAKRKK